MSGEALAVGGLAYLLDIFNPKIAVLCVAGISPNEARAYLSLSAVSVGVSDPTIHSYLKNIDLLQKTSSEGFFFLFFNVHVQLSSKMAVNHNLKSFVYIPFLTVHQTHEYVAKS